MIRGVLVAEASAVPTTSPAAGCDARGDGRLAPLLVVLAAWRRRRGR